MTERLDLHGEQGLAGASLVIVIAWALAAVMMLTGTLVAAQAIDETVFGLTNTLTAIDDNTTAVALAEDTTSIARDIETSAAPLTGQLDEVIGSAQSIDGTVTAILGNAGEINQTAKTINSTVLGIGTTADDIGASVDSIHAGLSAVLPVTQSINQGVKDINGRADTIISLVQGIKSDTANILTEVGRKNQNAIHGHANSIDCSPLLTLTSSKCDRAAATPASR